MRETFDKKKEVDALKSDHAKQLAKCERDRDDAISYLMQEK